MEKKDRLPQSLQSDADRRALEAGLPKHLPETDTTPILIVHDEIIANPETAARLLKEDIVLLVKEREKPILFPIEINWDLPEWDDK